MINRINKCHGEGYFTAAGIPQLPKKIRDPCDAEKCIQHCQIRVSDDDRQLVFKEYYSFQNINQQWQYIANCLGRERITPKCLRRNRKRGTRKPNIEYNLYFRNEKQRVCKTMFLNTLNISDTVIKTVLSKCNENGVFVENDKRGYHPKKRKMIEDNNE